MKFVKITLPCRCTSVHFFVQPTRTPARDGCGRLVSQSVGRWSQISQAIQVQRLIHLGDTHSKQWTVHNL